MIGVSGVGKSASRGAASAADRKETARDQAREEGPFHCVWKIGGSVFESGSSFTGA